MDVFYINCYFFVNDDNDKNDRFHFNVYTISYFKNSEGILDM